VPETKKKNIVFVKRAKIVRFCKKLITIYYRFCHKWWFSFVSYVWTCGK